MIDNIFLDAAVYLKLLPSLVVSLINYLICILAIAFLKKFFGFAGLSCYIAFATIIANIQVLYPTIYEIFAIEAFLGTVIFSTTFLVTDIINGEYGADKAKKAAYIGFVLNIFFFINIILTLGHKPLNYTISHEFSISQDTINKNISSIEQIFLPIPRLMIASYIAYLLSQLTEIWIFNFMNKVMLFKNKYIKHNIALFISSIFIDTFVFTILGLCLLAQEPLKLADFLSIFTSATLIRIICNLANTFYFKLLKYYKI